MEEIWKDVVGYENIYMVSNLGNVKSLDRITLAKNGFNYPFYGKIIVPLNIGNYLKVHLSNKNLIKTVSIHKIVVLAFIDKDYKYGKMSVIDHIDNNPHNNKIDNLQIITNRENCSKDKKGYSSKYVGVYYHKKNKKWVAHITINKKIKNLGSFKLEEDARDAYNDVLANLF